MHGVLAGYRALIECLRKRSSSGADIRTAKLTYARQLGPLMPSRGRFRQRRISEEFFLNSITRSVNPPRASTPRRAEISIIWGIFYSVEDTNAISISSFAQETAAESLSRAPFLPHAARANTKTPVVFRKRTVFRVIRETRIIECSLAHISAKFRFRATKTTGDREKRSEESAGATPSAYIFLQMECGWFNLGWIRIWISTRNFSRLRCWKILRSRAAWSTSVVSSSDPAVLRARHFRARGWRRSKRARTVDPFAWLWTLPKNPRRQNVS